MLAKKHCRLSGAVFSDGNASDRDTKFFAFQKVDDLAVLVVKPGFYFSENTP